MPIFSSGTSYNTSDILWWSTLVFRCFQLATTISCFLPSSTFGEAEEKKKQRSRRDAWAFISLPAVTTFPRIFAFSTSSVTFFFHRGDCSSSVLSFPVFCEPFAGLSRSKFSITLGQIRILRTTWRSLYSNVTFLEKADEEAKSKHFRHRRYLLNTPEHTSLGKATPLWRFVFMFNQSVIPLVRGFTYRTACR